MLLDPEPKRLAQLIADLNNDAFTVREQASATLGKYGATIEPALRTALSNTRSREVQRRLDEILVNIEEQPLSTEMVRTIRVVQALEYSGTVEALQLLEKLAQGDKGYRLTTEAQAAVERLKKRP